MTKSPEIWVQFKPVADYEISNHGRVRSKTRQISYTNHHGNPVFYTVFSQQIKIDTSGTPIFRITVLDKETGEKKGLYFRLEDELKDHFGKKYHFNNTYNGVDANRGRSMKDRKIRQSQKELVTPSIPEEQPVVQPLVNKLKEKFREVKDTNELVALKEENKRLKEVINLLLGDK